MRPTTLYASPDGCIVNCTSFILRPLFDGFSLTERGEETGGATIVEVFLARSPTTVFRCVVTIVVYTIQFEMVSVAVLQRPYRE